MQRNRNVAKGNFKVISLMRLKSLDHLHTLMKIYIPDVLKPFPSCANLKSHCTLTCSPDRVEGDSFPALIILD